MQAPTEVHTQGTAQGEQNHRSTAWSTVNPDNKVRPKEKKSVSMSDTQDESVMGEAGQIDSV